MMPCLVGCLALMAPRIAIFLMVIFSDYLGKAYETLIWPLLGFFFLPLTTLAYAWAWHFGNGSIEGAGIVAIVLAVLIDLGLMGGSGSSGRRKWRVLGGKAGPGAPGRVNVHVKRS